VLEVVRVRRYKRRRSIAKATELSLAAPQVVAMRAARMLAAGINPSARDRREFESMGTEKVLAFWESMQAMGLEVAKAQQQYALYALSHWWSPWVSPWSVAASATKVLEKGLGPVHKRASANARRLRRIR
jgi:hypothetical protein